MSSTTKLIKGNYVLKEPDIREMKEARRRAYDLHVKLDIALNGRKGSMNKTFDPFYHAHPSIPIKK